jgi:hypothetical protein
VTDRFHPVTCTAEFTATESTSLNVRFHYVDNTSGSWSDTEKVVPTPKPQRPALRVAVPDRVALLTRA